MSPFSLAGASSQVLLVGRIAEERFRLCDFSELLESFGISRPWAYWSSLAVAPLASAGSWSHQQSNFTYPKVQKFHSFYRSFLVRYGNQQCWLSAYHLTELYFLTPENGYSLFDISLSQSRVFTIRISPASKPLMTIVPTLPHSAPSAFQYVQSTTAFPYTLLRNSRILCWVTILAEVRVAAV